MSLTINAKDSFQPVHPVYLIRKAIKLSVFNGGATVTIENAYQNIYKELDRVCDGIGPDEDELGKPLSYSGDYQGKKDQSWTIDVVSDSNRDT